MEKTISEHVRVSPKIGLLNKYVQKVKKVAISSIHPVYADAEGRELEAFNICVEGPAKYLSYFNRLIDDANLKVG